LRRYPVRLIFREEAERIFVVSVFHGNRHDRHWRRRN
jgi:hypothetical protein